jgi:hypothetical protein
LCSKRLTVSWFYSFRSRWNGSPNAAERAEANRGP